MIEPTMLYDLIYALAARDGREGQLFGDCAPLAHQAFERSLASGAFPELWFEVPLAGRPWFDLHALTHRDDVSPESRFASDRCGGHPEIFAWFAQSSDTRQLALSFDVSTGDIDHPAVQLLLARSSARTACDFLAAAGREDATQAYRAFLRRLPHDWFACYIGVFPGRRMEAIRIECIPSPDLQRTYAQDSGLLREHLQQLGLRVDDEMLARLRLLADTPHRLEFQLDVCEDGRARETFSASLRFPPVKEGDWEPYDPDGPAGQLMRTIEGWGLADERWRTLAQTAFVNRVSLQGETKTIYCYPAFIKLKWRDTTPVDSKAYLMAGILEQRR